jgi:hypothetical protein
MPIDFAFPRPRFESYGQDPVFLKDCGATHLGRYHSTMSGACAYVHGSNRISIDLWG